jgi:hypothetical protein
MGGGVRASDRCRHSVDARLREPTAGCARLFAVADVIGLQDIAMQHGPQRSAATGSMRPRGLLCVIVGGSWMLNGDDGAAAITAWRAVRAGPRTGD